MDCTVAQTETVDLHDHRRRSINSVCVCVCVCHVTSTVTRSLCYADLSSVLT